jgi:hypothetical protein
VRGVTTSRPLKRAVDSLAPWLVVGVVGWVGVVWLGWMLWQQDPPRAGFDLALLLEAARRVVAGESPYDPAMVAGVSPDATSLFYSYPPPVAQAMTLLAWLPDGVVLVLWAVGATAGLAFVTALIARSLGRDGRRAAIRAVCVAPLVAPFAIAILFGNLDAWYPLAYGLLVLTALPGVRGRGGVVAAGIAVGAIVVAKLHPGSLVVWIAARAWAERGGPQARVLAATAATGFVIVVASLLVGGVQPWLDYVAVVRAGAGAELVDPRNMGPVSLLGQATGLDDQALRVAQVVVTASVLIVSALAALRVRDPLASVAIAAAASLATLPVTWYHYPVALIPVAAALAIGHPATRPRVVIALVVLDIAIVSGWLLWTAVIVLLVAALESARRARRATHVANTATA